MEARYELVGIHRATLPCLSCKGEGTVRGAPCALCDGRKTYTVGCIQQDEAPSNVELDLNHPSMCYCRRCDRYIDPAEVTRQEPRGLA